jgi:hypothetical protein
MPLRSKRFHTLNSNNLFFSHLRFYRNHKFRAGGTFPTYPEIRGCAWDSDCRNAVKVQAWGFETQPLCCPLNGRFRWIELIRQIEHNTPLRSKRFHTLNSNNLFFSHLRFQHKHKFRAGGKLPTYPEIGGCTWDSGHLNDVQVQPRGSEARLLLPPLDNLCRWIDPYCQIRLMGATQA